MEAVGRAVARLRELVPPDDLDGYLATFGSGCTTASPVAWSI